MLSGALSQDKLFRSGDKAQAIVHHDGEEIIPAADSLHANHQFMLKSMNPITTFGILATRKIDETDLIRESFEENNELTRTHNVSRQLYS